MNRVPITCLVCHQNGRQGTCNTDPLWDLIDPLAKDDPLNLKKAA